MFHFFRFPMLKNQISMKLCGREIRDSRITTVGFNVFESLKVALTIGEGILQSSMTPEKLKKVLVE
uniref:Uncharacterized protein n=1 Tax=Rhizophagus irregularis (strain DAOM 181602 / DAOM 197198 / MUCL 43194) TaxID=747089 RepID=U9T4T8_RHIID